MLCLRNTLSLRWFASASTFNGCSEHLLAGIEYIKVPTWLFHGGNDAVVPINTSLQIMHRYGIIRQ